VWKSACAPPSWASNTARHGGGGCFRIVALRDAMGLEIERRDRGPGLSESEAGLLTARTPGRRAGPATRAGSQIVVTAMDEVAVERRPGGGLVITARRYIRAPRAELASDR
jgi:anti-sigma regulatory factor (Ser/Thr protein kinase)